MKPCLRERRPPLCLEALELRLLLADDDTAWKAALGADSPGSKGCVEASGPGAQPREAAESAAGRSPEFLPAAAWLRLVSAGWRLWSCESCVQPSELRGYLIDQLLAEITPGERSVLLTELSETRPAPFVLV
jgi:hypothetical protein